jgi:hypothetical protein
MLSKLTYLEKEERERVEKLFGITHYNEPPANFKEVDEAAIAVRHSNYSFYYQWFQQVRFEENKPLLGIHCFGSANSQGFAMSFDYWGKRIRYFTFAGCIHEYREPTREEYADHHDWPGNCYHISICDKCGYWYTVDSSD